MSNTRYERKAATRRLEAGDVWLLGGDRRFEDVVMPILTDGEDAYRARARRALRWATIVPLPTDMPFSSIGFRDWLGGFCLDRDWSPVEQLTLLMRYLASPLRHEPLNLPWVHYPVACFGGFFSCRILLLIRPADAGRTQLYAYLPDYHALEFRGALAGSGYAPPPGSLTICCVGQHWLVAGKYGEYAPYGVTLDAGIVNAQLGYLAALLGWTKTELGVDPAVWHERLALPEAEETVLFAAELGLAQRDPDWSFLAQARPRRIACWEPSKESHRRFPKLRAISEWFGAFEHSVARTGPDAGDVETLPESDTNADVLEVMRRRTAGNDTMGFAQVNPPVADDHLARFIRIGRRLAARRGRLAGEELLELRFAWINPIGPPMGLYRADLSRVELGLDNDRFLQVIRDCLHNARQYYNLSSMMLEVFVTVDTAAATRRFGRNALRAVHLAAGGLTHDCCMAAAALGHFARPVRMFRDARLTNALELPGQLVIQVLAGASRHRNYGLRLL